MFLTQNFKHMKNKLKLSLEALSFPDVHSSLIDEFDLSGKFKKIRQKEQAPSIDISEDGTILILTKLKKSIPNEA